MTAAPDSIDRPSADAVNTLAAQPRLLVALDFDGTVSTLVDDPAEARVLPEATAAITELESFPDTWVAYVSGRPLDSLAAVTRADESALLIGSHGVEVRLGAETVELGLTDDESRRLADLDSALEALVSRTENSHLERKPVGLGVHTRLVDAALVPEVHRQARDAADRIGGFMVRDGKDILEFAIRDATKGDGIRLLRDRLHASAVMYVGDDVTDEDGFAVLRDADMGVKVGPGPTRAGFRVADPADVSRLLTSLARARAAAGREQF